MRPRPLAAGFQFCRPGSVSCASKLASLAVASRDRLSEMPLAVTHFTNSRREGRMFPPFWSNRRGAPAKESITGKHHARPATVEIDSLRTLESCAPFKTSYLLVRASCDDARVRFDRSRFDIACHLRSAIDAGPDPGVTRVGH